MGRSVPFLLSFAKHRIANASTTAFTVAPPFRFRYASRMSESAKPEPHPFDKLKDAMRKILTVSKPEILRREAEEKQRRNDAKSAPKVSGQAS